MTDEIQHTHPLDTVELNISMEELFDKDPLELSDQEKDAIIEALSSARQKYFEEENAAKLSGRRTKRNVSVSNPKALDPVDAQKIIDGLKLELDI